MPANAEFIEGSNISINHLGIVAGAFDTLGIETVIDPAIPKTRHHHLIYGQLVKAMVLNGRTPRWRPGGGGRKQTQRRILKWTFFSVPQGPGTEIRVEWLDINDRDEYDARVVSDSPGTRVGAEGYYF